MEVTCQPNPKCHQPRRAPMPDNIAMITATIATAIPPLANHEILFLRNIGSICVSPVAKYDNSDLCELEPESYFDVSSPNAEQYLAVIFQVY